MVYHFEARHSTGIAGSNNARRRTVGTINCTLCDLFMSPQKRVVAFFAWVLGIRFIRQVFPNSLQYIGSPGKPYSDGHWLILETALGTSIHSGVHGDSGINRKDFDHQLIERGLEQRVRAL